MTEDILSVDGIKKYLSNDDYKIEVYESLDSTNAVLKGRAQKGEEQWTVVIADAQTSGRGRFVRKFHSPSGSGIYMSILLKPTLTAEKSVLITAAAATATALTIEELSQKDTGIKWVNDVFMDNKKVCGILTEGGINTKTGGFDWVVVGIGINVYTPQNGFEAEISDIAGAVFNKITPDTRNRLTARVIEQFRIFYEQLESKTFFNDYKNRMLSIGKEIKVIKGGEIRQARCTGLDSDCRLQVAYPDLTEEYLTSGEISIKLT